MSELSSRESSDDDDLPEAAGTPAGYREATPVLPGFRLACAAVTVELSEQPRHARYRYDCRLETTGETPARYWYYEVPADRGEISNVRGWDARGTLQTREQPTEGGGMRIEVRMRGPVRAGESCDFSFGYESRIRSVVTEGWRSRTVCYSDWIIFNLACDLLRVRVVFPARSVRVAAIPAPPHDEENQVTYTLRNLRPLETIGYTVGYRRTQIGAPFYRWLLSAIGSGIVGALIALFIEGW